MRPMHEHLMNIDGVDETSPGMPPERPLEPEHPMLLMPAAVHGDPDVMLECLVAEYALLGFSADEIVAMFGEPFFEGAFGLRETIGADEVRRRVARILGRSGTLRVRVVQAPPDPEAAWLGGSGEDTTLDDCFESGAAPSPAATASACQGCLLVQGCTQARAAHAPLEG